MRPSIYSRNPKDLLVKLFLHTAALFVWIALCAAGVWAADLVMPSRRDDRIDVESMVWAILQVENGKWGTLGGKGNMMRTTWKDRTSLSYERSRDPRFAIPVYRAHVRWVMQQLDKAGYYVTPARIYDCWWFGVEGTKLRIEYAKLSETAVRCQNLYDEHVIAKVAPLAGQSVAQK